MFPSQLSRVGAVQAPAAMHARYWASVTSFRDISNVETLTVCAGLSLISPVFDPIWNVPPAIRTQSMEGLPVVEVVASDVWPLAGAGGWPPRFAERVTLPAASR